MRQCFLVSALLCTGRALLLTIVVAVRYASLYFVVAVDATDNELITLETVHHFVEVLDRYFGNVCELDIIFNFHKVRQWSWPAVSLLPSPNIVCSFVQAYYLLDEVLLNGHLQEANKMTILDACAAQDAMMEETKDAKGER